MMLADHLQIFIIEGLMTVFFGVIALVFTPNFPEKAQRWLLKPNEREYLITKLKESRGLEEKGSAADDVSIWKVGGQTDLNRQISDEKRS